jgi:hypothetical protein
VIITAKIKTHRPSIKTVYAKLERKEPFNNIEKAQYSEKEQALIRGIQLRDKEDKQQAIQTYTNYQIEGKKATKSLASSIRNYIKDKYPKHGGTIHHEVEDFEKGKTRTVIITQNKKQVKKFLGDKKNKQSNEVVYERVRSASERYPNASLQELRHGVNSKWSQEYRVKHGLNRNYK